MPLNRGYPNMVEAKGGKMMPQDGNEMPQPEAAAPGPEGQGGAGGGEAVIDALRKIGMFAAAQAEKGNESIMQAFKALVEAMGSAAGQKPPMPEQGAPEGPKAAPVEMGNMSKRGATPVL